MDDLDEVAVIRGADDLPTLLREQGWTLQESSSDELGETQHWRRHDVSITVTLVPPDFQLPLTTLFVRHGPWESSDWDELEIDTADLLRDLLREAGLHGVARPARLPGLWRVQPTEFARGADIVTSATQEDGTRRVTRRTDGSAAGGDTDDAGEWVFTDDGTPVPIAPPLPVVAVSSREDVVQYVLGDQQRDATARRQVLVVLGGRAIKGTSPADAHRQLAADHPEVYRRALTAAAGRPARKGARFDVARARAALERLAEGDPTLPLASIGEYVELVEPDPTADRVPLAGPTPTRAVRGVVVEVTPEPHARCGW